MVLILSLSLLGSVPLNPLLLLPDSVEVTVINRIDGATIESLHFLLPESTTIEEAFLDRPIPLGDSTRVTLPFRYISRVVVGTDRMGNYRRALPAFNPLGDTLSFSRADKEFGGFFDVILGSELYFIRNVTTVPITAVYLRADTLAERNILGSNPLLTNESIFLWMDADSAWVWAVDIEGNSSATLPIQKSREYGANAFRISDFMEPAEPVRAGEIRVISGLNGGEITGIEVYPVEDEPFYLNLEQEPLTLWDQLTIRCPGEVEYLICYDSMNRSFSIDTMDPETEAFIVDWWHLDFDFAFPDRRR